LKNGNTVTYDLEYGTSKLVFVGMIHNLKNGKNCIAMYGDEAIQAKISDLVLSEHNG